MVILKNYSDNTLIVFGIILIVFIIGAPIAVIESINVLFPYNEIEVNFQTWLSAGFLIAIFAPTKGK